MQLPALLEAGENMSSEVAAVPPAGGPTPTAEPVAAPAPAPAPPAPPEPPAPPPAPPELPEEDPNAPWVLRLGNYLTGSTKPLPKSDDPLVLRIGNYLHEKQPGPWSILANEKPHDPMVRSAPEQRLACRERAEFCGRWAGSATRHVSQRDQTGGDSAQN